MASMILIDVNVLVYAHRHDARDHARYRSWLESAMDSGESFGISDVALCGFVRIVTHPRIYPDPTSVQGALAYAKQLREHDSCVLVSPSVRHWQIFDDLCRAAGAKGSMITDAYFAALAIESGSEWITADRDYARFPGLRWRHPLT
jgi:toxin-antitoxin system PIN domain toxin